MSVAPDARLTEQQRSLRLELDHDGQEGQKGQEEQQTGDRGDDVDDPFADLGGTLAPEFPA